MKVLIIQEAGRHKANKLLRECFAIQYAFIRNGWKADIWGLGHDNFSNTPDFPSYDMLFCIENYSIDWLPDFSKISGPLKVHWIIDLHCAGPNNYINMSNGCDIILHSTKCFIDEYSLLTKIKKHIWFPNGVDSFLLCKRYEHPKIGGACFVATPHNNRKYIAELVGAQFFTLLGEDMIKKVSESFVQFNISISPYDINYRCWETISLGTVLVTNNVPDLDTVGFKHGENCLIYNNLGEAAEYLCEAQENEGLRKKLEIGGLDLASKNSYTFRIKNFLKELRLPYTETHPFS